MKSQIRLDAGRVEVTFLTVDDQCVVEYVAGQAPENQVAAVLNCIQLGARALSYASDQSGTTMLTDAMKQAADGHKELLETVSKQTRDTVLNSAKELPKKLETVLKILQKDLAKTLDPDSAASIVGKLQAALVAGLSKETAKVADALDLQNPASALSRLNALHEKRQEKLEEQIHKIAEELAARAAAHVVRRKTTSKGFSFEDTLEAYVANESRPRHDVVTRTSRVAGIDGNDKGDITIEVAKAQAHGPGLNIVIEAKDSQISFPALVRDVEKAMSNRGAVFGIGVTTNPDITRGSSLIIPVGDDKLVVCAPPVGDEEFELLGVSLGLEMGRWKAIMGRLAPTQHMDLNRINANVSAAFNVMKRFTEAKRKMTSVKTAVDETCEYIDAIRSDLQKELGNLRTAIAEELEGGAAAA
jgi:hypothetical protein